MPAKFSETEESMMRHAIEAAMMGLGETFPNPSVGAVIAHGSEIVGVGFHRKAGLPHAEVEAIKSAGGRTKGADLFVTLEPCDHFGRTPPCTDAIIRSGIRRVFISTLDPNPLVNGRGMRKLRKSGLDVKVGLLADEAKDINYAYFKFMTYRKPFVTLKVAQTVDGMIATGRGQSKWITSPQARAFARKLRSEAQAIIVGASTVREDDPMLLPSPRRKANWIRCVLTTDLNIPAESRLVKTCRQYKTIAYYVEASGKRVTKLIDSGMVLKRVARGEDGVDLGEVIEDLASKGIMHVIVEGGARVFSSFLSGGFFDRLVVLIAPMIMGGAGLPGFVDFEVSDIKDCPRLRVKSIKEVARDIMIDLWRG
ncbi:MAG: bifunctional diaminohydroxyphosphoribosylaminopyrimidine deaminase/5-amino-6-(5-phosphoribosylamino)uracil reductase RibD [bacterium]